MLEQLLNHIKQHTLFLPNNRILLAVSGGMDSVVMLHLFKEAGFQIGVAHCNFQLRGEDSMKDEIFVQEMCADKSIPFYCKRFETDEYATEKSLSIQMAARDLRYAWFNELVSKERYDFIATAHHLNDSLETILLHLTKGTSLQGFAGIPLKNGKVIRPMLFASHDMIKEYAILHQIKWREDLSNSTADYQRNFIRHQVVPKLKQLNPSLEETTQKSLTKIYGALELMNLGKAEFDKQFRKAEDGLHVTKKAFESFENGAAVLWEAIHHYGFNLEQCQSVIQALHGQPGKKFISAHYQLTIDRDEIVVSERMEDWEPIVIAKSVTNANLGPFSMELRIVESPELKFDQNKNEAMVDVEKLKFPLTWRKWKPGDNFYPMGFDHKKKLSDFLIDNKIPLPAKELVTVLESEGEIVWVVGHRIDNRFKLTSSTRNALIISVSPHFM
jgi:tRNA(Ile)-lysidine synthase